MTPLSSADLPRRRRGGSDLSHKTQAEIRQWYEDHAHLAPRVYDPPKAQARMAFLKGWLDELDLVGAHCLDVGCGLGQYAVHMAEQGAFVTAFDISGETILNAEDHFRVLYARESWDTMRNDWAGFDLAFVSESIEHSQDPQRLVDDLAHRTDRIIASVPIAESESNIGWGVQGHLHVFRMPSFLALFDGWEVERQHDDGTYGYVQATTTKESR